ncbi:hypothetical protein J8J14_00905 [Roseomonas sp. SSH11]|uniref:Secreted protein n=1 Tax=Pararoseomonas baculiformis TaxID=2820812 RepID=A0ABS4A8J9_9PROT|nr:hypothetical protein [Pararoseomonas baculiformis]MBP0443323.1 hypothetical protein [Pararoseomonas baculiformis]
MRAKLPLLAALPAMGLALLSFAQVQAQTTQPETARQNQATPGQAPTVADPNPHTPTPRAPDMPTYLGMLEKAEQDLRQQIARTEGGVQPTQNGAMSPDIIHLMQVARNSWQIAERAPQPFAGGDAHTRAMQEMRHRVSEIDHQRPTLPPPEAISAARGVLQSLESLRQAAASSPAARG